MNNAQSQLPSWDLHNQRVFLRVDLNVPLKNGTIIDDFRLRSVIPTISLLQEKGGKIILATHIGRPKNHEEDLSTKHLIKWFLNQGFETIYAPTLEDAQILSQEKNGAIILLENLRFYKGEKNHDLTFAQQLKNLADYYVDDAFALLHRNDTSITLLAELFSRDHRTFGLLIEKELKGLAPLKYNPKKPYTVIVGGGKPESKINYLTGFLPKASTILLCPAMDFTFLKALGKEVGNSLVAYDLLETAKNLLLNAQKLQCSILFPKDYIVANKTFDGPLSTVDSDNFPQDGVGISIGPKTIDYYSSYITSSQGVFLNAGMGSLQRPETLTGLQGLLEAMANSSAYTIVGGGESVGTVFYYNQEREISFLSTGGGATLAYLSDTPLPGLEVLQ